MGYDLGQLQVSTEAIRPAHLAGRPAFRLKQCRATHEDAHCPGPRGGHIEPVPTGEDAMRTRSDTPTDPEALAHSQLWYSRMAALSAK